MLLLYRNPSERVRQSERGRDGDEKGKRREGGELARAQPVASFLRAVEHTAASVRLPPLPTVHLKYPPFHLLYVRRSPRPMRDRLPIPHPLLKRLPRSLVKPPHHQRPRTQRRLRIERSVERVVVRRRKRWRRVHDRLSAVKDAARASEIEAEERAGGEEQFARTDGAEQLGEEALPFGVDNFGREWGRRGCSFGWFGTFELLTLG